MKNYTKYIVTRETVEKREQNQYAPNAATTEKQKVSAVRVRESRIGVIRLQTVQKPRFSSEIRD